MNNPSQTKESILALLNDLSADTRKALYDLCVAEAIDLLSAAWTTEHGFVEIDTTSGNPIEVKAVPLEALKEIFQQ